MHAYVGPGACVDGHSPDCSDLGWAADAAGRWLTISTARGPERPPRTKEAADDAGPDAARSADEQAPHRSGQGAPARADRRARLDLGRGTRDGHELPARLAAGR